MDYKGEDVLIFYHSRLANLFEVNSVILLYHKLALKQVSSIAMFFFFFCFFFLVKYDKNMFSERCPSSL